MEEVAVLALLSAFFTGGAWWWVCNELRPYLDLPESTLPTNARRALWVAALFTAATMFLACGMLLFILE